MRLLNTSTLQLQEFSSRNLPAYSILSHTWGDEEVLFDDIRDGKGKEKAGYSKIIGSCALAAQDGWEYIWIDTCCIDKSSSAELSEAINSMYNWYRKAEVCYAYLEDVLVSDNDRDTIMTAFRRSRWFTRGWTLQELLAPHVVMFYGRDWNEIGTKSGLSQEISDCTGIERSDFVGYKDANVAVKMYWASRRETTRIEDTAYCLLGIFGVNMPLLYGEGKAAFLRLQLEILKTSDDETIFAWDDHLFHNTGMLASSPGDFQNSGNVRQILFDKGRPEYSMTNKGLRIELLLREPTELDQESKRIIHGNSEVYAAALNCTQDPSDRPLEIHLKTDTKINDKALNPSAIRDQPMQLTRCFFANGFYARQRLGTIPETRIRDYLKNERATVYVKQVDKTKNVLESFKPCKVSFRYPQALFHLSKVWSPFERYIYQQDGGRRVSTFFSVPFGAIFKSRGTNHPEWFAILVTQLQNHSHDLAATFMNIPSGTQTLGKIVQFFDTSGRECVGNSYTFRHRLGGFPIQEIKFDGQYMTLDQFDRTHRFDRISKLLSSGNTVAVAVRPHNLGRKDRGEEKQWLVDITVDANVGG